MIITISGVPGSGKTSVGKILAQKLGVPFYSIGALWGKMAIERGLTLDELNVLGEEEASTDKIVDDYQRELGIKEKAFVIEGRLSWYFIPHSFKIFLDCTLSEASRRIYEERKLTNKERSDEPKYVSPENVRAAIQNRTKSDIRRYAKYYNVNHLEPKHYDLVLNTSEMNGPGETAEKILNVLPCKDSAATS